MLGRSQSSPTWYKWSFYLTWVFSALALDQASNLTNYKLVFSAEAKSGQKSSYNHSPRPRLWRTALARWPPAASTWSACSRCRRGSGSRWGRGHATARCQTTSTSAPRPSCNFESVLEGEHGPFLFIFVFSTRYKSNINSKSDDGVLGTRTRAAGGLDESTELRWHP